MEKYKKVERVLNEVMKRNFPWWEKIEIAEIGSRKGSYWNKEYRDLVIKGFLWVDEDWVEEQYEKVNDHRKFFKDNYDEENELDLGEIITVEEAAKIYEIAKYIILGILDIEKKEDINEVSLTYLHLRFV